MVLTLIVGNSRQCELRCDAVVVCRPSHMVKHDGHRVRRLLHLDLVLAITFRQPSHQGWPNF